MLTITRCLTVTGVEECCLREVSEVILATVADASNKILDRKFASKLRKNLLLGIKSFLQVAALIFP